MTNTAPVSWEEIEHFSKKHKAGLQKSIGENVSVDLFISFVAFHLRTERILNEFTTKLPPKQFIELVKIVMAGVREERVSQPREKV